MSALPTDPITDMATSSVIMHELYLSYLAAGFTECQALYLASVFLRASIQKGEGS